MATIVTRKPSAGRRVPGSPPIRRLDALGPLVLLGAVLALVAAAGYESHSPGAGTPPSFSQLRAE